MAAAQVSSPRLPSPPPLTEDFIHPRSPNTLSEDHGKLENASGVDYGASRRIRAGTKAADMAEGPPVVELDQIESAFALTEHLKALHNAAIHPDADTVRPIDRETAVKLAQPPPDVERAAWLHELCRFLCQKVNAILVALFADAPPCSANTCPEMRASEWQYLCAVHDPPKSCCAIDYCCHTLDWAATTLTSLKNFPNYGTGRGSAASEPANQHGQVRQLTNVFRRVYRIFAHAWFQHRDMFWKVEHGTGLYVFFKTVCDVYQLIPDDNYTIPPEAEGGEPAVETADEQMIEQPILLRRDTKEKAEEEPEIPEATLGADVAAGNTTKRHKHSPSTGARPVDTVIEENEEEDEAKSNLTKANTTVLDHEPSGSTAEELPPPLDSEIPDQGDVHPAQSAASDHLEIGTSELGKADAASQEDVQDTPIAAKPEVSVSADANAVPAEAAANSHSAEAAPLKVEDEKEVETVVETEAHQIADQDTTTKLEAPDQSETS